ncbi:putative nucleotidyltransferase [Desulfofundulus luciae]|uniref:Nucleotidyltransferase n=1 Tax=Desulfofundulus luciae TaxID=74702 RepID=A0ABU0AZB8_9FIRM|nr:nucleotidyltransferase domain-containing protein [Desulfofundulus luciae]MDQ0285603.1 putative nucleotidyltransferase [Desulfofundulus luciae]
MTAKNSLPEFEQRSLEQVAEKHGLAMILFFGSRVTGKHRFNSDLDVGVI